MVNESAKSCSSCRQDATEDEDFCNSCGARLGKHVDLETEQLEFAVQKTDELISIGDPSVDVVDEKESHNIIAIISMVLGLTAVMLVLMLYLCVIGGFIGSVAVLTGIIGLMNKKRRGFAIAGIVFSIIAFVFLALEFSSILYIYISIFF